MVPDVFEELDKPGDFMEVAPARLRLVVNALAKVGETLLRDDKRLAAAAAGSYRHPNGFEKLLLFESSSNWKFLLHSWDRESFEEAFAAEHEHNHRWPFVTLILRGSYRFESFDITANPSGDAYLYRYMSAGPSSVYSLLDAGKADSRLALSADLRAGSVCLSNSATVHRVVPVDFPLMTLFVQGPPDRTETSVVTHEPATKTGEIALERFTADEWRERLALRLGQVAPPRLLS